MTARYLTLKQAAAMCATSPETIRYWIHIGKLDAFKPGRSVLIREADLTALIEGSAVAELRATRAKRAGKARAA